LHLGSEYVDFGSVARRIGIFEALIKRYGESNIAYVHTCRDDQCALDAGYFYFAFHDILLLSDSMICSSTNALALAAFRMPTIRTTWLISDTMANEFSGHIVPTFKAPDHVRHTLSVVERSLVIFVNFFAALIFTDESLEPCENHSALGL
jgi:hypothetical protein